MMTSGIYMIRNKKTGQIYIGQSKNIEKRWLQHNNISDIDFDMRKYGIDEFSFVVLEELDTYKERLEREKYWINYWNSRENLYNKTGVDELMSHDLQNKSEDLPISIHFPADCMRIDIIKHCLDYVAMLNSGDLNEHE